MLIPYRLVVTRALSTTTRETFSRMLLLFLNTSAPPSSQVSMPLRICPTPSDLHAQDPIATQITTAMMGPRPKWTFCSANSAMATLPGGTPQRQPVHSDADFAHPDHPFALVVNIPLVTTTPENGSTEIWLGTHNGFGLDAQEGAHGERASGRIREELLRQRQEISPPLQPVI